MYVLVPTEVHDLFTLHEILNWVAFKGLPLGHDYGIDEMFEDARTEYPEEFYLTSHLGAAEKPLPPYPDYPEYPSPDVLKYIPDIPAAFKERAEEVHAEYAKETVKWQASSANMQKARRLTKWATNSGLWPFSRKRWAS